MKRHTLAALAFCAALGAGTAAQATLIDFEDVAQAPGSNTIGGDVVSRGFLFDSSTDHSHLVNDNFNSFNGTTWLGWDNLVGRNVVTMSPVGGGSFSVGTLGLTEFFCNGSPCDGAANGTGRVRFIGNLSAGGTVSLDVDLDLVADGAGAADDFQTVALNWGGLSSLEMFAVTGGGDMWFAIDNVNTDVVPLPGTLALLGAGVLGLAGIRRRHA